MPLLLLNIFGWAKKNPVAAVQATVVAVLAGLAVWLYFDYTGTKRENAALTSRVEKAEADFASAKTRIDEFVVAQALFEADLQALRDNSVAVRNEIRGALKGMSAAEVEGAYEINPEGAAVDLNARLNSLFSMFDRKTSGRPAASKSK